jgi:polar amino acid transport system substrate-binding protein
MYKKFIFNSLIFFLLISFFSSCSNEIKNDKKSINLYQKVLSSNVIKCGYITTPLYCIKDPNSGKIYGIFPEILDKASENLGLKIEWTEEVGWGTMIEGLLNNRYDIIGSAVLATTNRGKQADFSIPLLYGGLGVFVRENDNRFNSDLNLINNGNIRVATIDGEISEIVAKDEFPNSKFVSNPQLTDWSKLFLDIVSNKADVVVVEPFIAKLFLKNSPNTIKNISENKPIRVFPLCMMFNKGQEEFKSMLNVALLELINSGYVDKIIDKYEKDTPGVLYRVNYPYRIK